MTIIIMIIISVTTLVIALIRARQPESKLVSSPCSAITFHLSMIMMLMKIMIIIIIIMMIIDDCDDITLCGFRV